MLALVALSILLLIEVTTPGAFNLPMRFSSPHWKASSGWQQTRCRMIADLKHRVGLTGRSQREVIELLGVPDIAVDASTSAYLLCPTLDDVYILELLWQHERVASTRVRFI
jgi:hypothetical protein